jgi:RNA polymerase sigma-70 factor (ECF subfamily)
MMQAVMSAEMPSPDRALVSRARDGERDAREELAQRLGRSAYVFALQLTGRPETARDVAQDSVLRFFQHLHRFDAGRPVEPWLFQIVRNHVRDLMRRERVRRHESLDAWLEQGRAESVDPAADPAAHAERSDLQRRIWRTVSRLTEAHREILVLRDYHDLSYREIARVLAIPPGTVMSRLHAARTCLRASLVAEGEGPSADRAAGGAIDE